jgi:ADP-dependent NAD(P)H-hydrate dehydratase / NAD(P)H-hydrate epimerase
MEANMKLVSVAEMLSIEKEADAAGLTYDKMMENAGQGLAEAVQEAYGHLPNLSVLGLVGSGNNGGDTLVALASLLENGWKATALLLRPRKAKDPLVERVRQAGGEVLASQADLLADTGRLAELLRSHAVLLDGVLGTGVKLPLKTELRQRLGTIREVLLEMEAPPRVVAVDCPSGVDANSGRAAAECIPADLTVTMAAVKSGLLRFPAFKLLGELKVVGIGNLEGIEAWDSLHSFVVDRAYVQSILPDRPLDAHKGTFGTALVVAGSTNYTGAAWLAGQAAYRVGAGLVSMAVPGPLHLALAGHFPEATWVLLPNDLGVIARPAAEVLRQHLDRVTAMLFGPGFGLEDTTRDFISMLIGALDSTSHGGRIGFNYPAQGDISKTEKSGEPLPPLVIDADGLKLLARIPRWHSLLPDDTVLTPHPGELSVMTGIPKDEIQSDRFGMATRLAVEWGHVLVLKGALTVIAAPDGRLAIIPVASAALARAGTGDVLAGLIVGLRAQGVPAFEAASAGAWIHAQAGLSAARRHGNSASVLAGDVLASVMDVLAKI